MESNKENINRSPPKSRIPVLVRSLSIQGKRNHENNTNNDLIRETKTQRAPLTTIDHHNIHAPGPSCLKTASKLKQFPWHIDARHVTIRKKIDYITQFDHNKNNIKTNDDVDERNFIDWNVVENVHRNCEVETVATPSILRPVAENLRIKNIKKSLRRPHSQELQGISLPGKEDKNSDGKFKLRYKEQLKDRLETPDFSKLYTLLYLNVKPSHALL